jgi:hypothetical protein
MAVSSSQAALLRVSGAALLLGALLGACGGGEGGNGAGGSSAGGAGGLAGGAGAGGAPGVDAGPPCNSVVNGASFVTAVDAPDGGTSPPAAVGGTLASGTYFLTSTTFYPTTTCAPLNPTASTLVVTPSSPTAGVFEIAFRTATSAFTESLSYATSGTSLTLTLTCINPPVIAVGTMNTGPYSATATTFTNYLPNSNCGSHVDVYTLQ